MDEPVVMADSVEEEEIKRLNEEIYLKQVALHEIFTSRAETLRSLSKKYRENKDPNYATCKLNAARQLLRLRLLESKNEGIRLKDNLLSIKSAYGRLKFFPNAEVEINLDPGKSDETCHEDLAQAEENIEKFGVLEVTPWMEYFRLISISYSSICFYLIKPSMQYDDVRCNKRASPSRDRCQLFTCTL